MTALSQARRAEWYPGAPLEKRLVWRHGPDREHWASMDHDARWNLTVILDPSVLDPRQLRKEPLCWEALLEKWRAYKRAAC